MLFRFYGSGYTLLQFYSFLLFVLYMFVFVFLSDGFPPTLPNRPVATPPLLTPNYPLSLSLFLLYALLIVNEIIHCHHYQSNSFYVHY